MGRAVAEKFLQNTMMRGGDKSASGGTGDRVATNAAQDHGPRLPPDDGKNREQGPWLVIASIPGTACHPTVCRSHKQISVSRSGGRPKKRT